MLMNELLIVLILVTFSGIFRVKNIFVATWAMKTKYFICIQMSKYLRHGLWKLAQTS